MRMKPIVIALRMHYNSIIRQQNCILTSKSHDFLHACTSIYLQMDVIQMKCHKYALYHFLFILLLDFTCVSTFIRTNRACPLRTGDNSLSLSANNKSPFWLWFGDCACAIWPCGDAFNIDNGDGDYVKHYEIIQRKNERNKNKMLKPKQISKMRMNNYHWANEKDESEKNINFEMSSSQKYAKENFSYRSFSLTLK